MAAVALAEVELRQAVPVRSAIDVVEHRGHPALGTVNTRA